MRDLIQIRRDAAAAARAALVEALASALKTYDETVGQADADFEVATELRVSLFHGEAPPAAEPTPPSKRDEFDLEPFPSVVTTGPATQGEAP